MNVVPVGQYLRCDLSDSVAAAQDIDLFEFRFCDDLEKGAVVRVFSVNGKLNRLFHYAVLESIKIILLFLRKDFCKQK